MINAIDLARINPLQPIFNNEPAAKLTEKDISSPTFFDVFKRIVDETVELQGMKAQDMIDIMLGDVDDLERIQGTITKAQISMELLINVRNAVLDSYNEIIKMGV